MKNAGVLLLLFAAVLQACMKQDDPHQEVRDRTERQDIQINQYLQENNIAAEKDEQYGVYVETVEANPAGREIEANDVAVVKYKLSRLNGTLIGQSGEDSVRVRFDRNASFVPVSSYIALQHMRQGETARFYVPSNYAYGHFELADVIPAHSVVIMEVEVLDVLKNETEIRINDIAAIERVIAHREEEAVNIGTTGVRKVLLEEGEEDADEVQEDDAVTLRYTGRLLNGEVFDSNTSTSGFSFTLGRNSVIPGFEAAVETMRVGEKAKFYLPSGQAYGGAGWFVFPEAVRAEFKKDQNYRRHVNIPPHSVLEFELELVKITR